MPTIIERSRPVRFGCFVCACGVTLVAWFMVVVVATRMLPWPSPLVVLGDAESLRATLVTAPVRLLESGRGYYIVRGTMPTTVGDLYRAGVWLVLPAPSGGCAGRAPSRVARTML